MFRTLVISVCCLLYTAAYAQFSNVQKGDILEVSGVKGIVFKVDDNGEHGIMMSIKTLRGKKNVWGSKPIILDFVETSKSDGFANMQSFNDYLEKNNLPLSQYPAIEWCRNLGDGWYIPAVNELEMFVNWWLGNEIEEFDWDNDNEEEIALDSSKDMPQVINKKLLEAGGLPFLNGVYTSSKAENDKIYVYYYNKADNWWKFFTIKPSKLDTQVGGRAFYRF